MAPGPIRMPPVGALHESPPLAPVAQAECRMRPHEHQRTGIEHVRQRAGIILRIGRNLGGGLLTGRHDEPPELAVRYRREGDTEGVEPQPTPRRLSAVI